MKKKTKKRFALKIILSYLVLAILALISGFYMYSEISTYIGSSIVNTTDNKLLKTNSLLTQLYEAERLSKIALQKKTKKHFVTYAKKIDSVTLEIDTLKQLTENLHQKKLLDSASFLLVQKVENYNQLLKIKAQNKSNNPINTALEKFKKIEASLGKITAEALAPNFNQLSPQAQNSIIKLADYLNANVPKDTLINSSEKIDSILQKSKSVLTEVKKKNIASENALLKQEIEITQNDLELSQQLQHIIESFEQESLDNVKKNNSLKESVLKKSIRLAGLTAIVGFLIVGFFSFLIIRDFWKGQLYRQKLEKEKQFSDSLLKSREQLIHTVSHDLRSPLNAILGYTELLEQTSLSEKQHKFLNNIKSESGYVENLVTDLLDFSKLKSGQLTIHEIDFNPYDLLKETAENIAKLSTNKNVSLTLSIAENANKMVHGDSFRLKQILTNLIGNAYKFTPKGSVTVEAKIIINSLVVSIIDTGIGIPETKLKSVFKEFTQANNKTEQNYGGYGLGLAISKKLVGLLNGRISVKSSVGHGSSFTIEIPITPAKTKVTRQKPISKILIIDDDKSLLNMFGEMVKNIGIQPILCNNFSEIEKTNTQLKYNAILTDIQMPQLSGFDVLHMLKSGVYEHYKNQPIIAMTGNHNFNVRDCLNKGFSGVLLKPYTQQQFVTCLLKLNFKINAEKKKNYPKKIDANLYDLEILNSFLDKKDVDSVLNTFITETSKNIGLLTTAFEQAKISKINEVSHRMLPMLRQLKVSSLIIESLEKLEITNQLPLKKDMDNLINEIKLLTNTIAIDLTTNSSYTV